MIQTDEKRDQLKLILYLTGVASLLILVGSGVYIYLNESWIIVVELAVSGVLTAALVILYFRQTAILDSQKNLLTQELNREARQQHTETLRKRVRIWHGNPDKQTSQNPLEGPENNLPAISQSAFQSAPTGFHVLKFEDEIDFQVVPHQLQGDRYLEDLLENHAPDLKDAKSEIEQLYDEFKTLRNEFGESYDGGEVIEKEHYVLTPADYLANWVFNYLVRLRRGYISSIGEVKGRAISDLESAETTVYPDDSRVWVQSSVGGHRYRAIYAADMDSADGGALQDIRGEAKEAVKPVIQQIFERVDEEYPYTLANEAADVLDGAEEATRELERILIEYEGRPIYPGDCKYLREARIESDSVE